MDCEEELAIFLAGEQDRQEELAVLRAAAGHPAFLECQRTVEAVASYVAENLDGDEELWVYEAVERATQLAYLIAGGAGDEEIAAVVDQARGQRAALVLGLLDEAGSMTPERLAALDGDTLALLTWYAAPWPVRWLFAPEQDADGDAIRPRVINLFHGPGGWSVGIRDVLGADVDMIGVDLDPGAVATATAAGFEMICASVTDLDPENPALNWVVGVILSPPCQPFSPAGLHLGRYAAAILILISAIRNAGGAAGFLRRIDIHGQDVAIPRSGESWEEVRAPLAGLEDPRAGLMAEVVIWPLAILACGGSIQWVAVEQSSALPAEIEDALLLEFTQAGWGIIEVETLDAVEYGAASHRRRRFITAYRAAAPFLDVRPAGEFPETTFAQCVGWAPGRRVNTRGQRGLDPVTGRPKGGNAFTADQPSPCITATAYGWKDEQTGERISQSEIGRLVGFPGAYPWQHVGRGEGIRNRAQQAADAVCPMVAAAVIGRVLGRDWERRTRAYVEELYRPGPAAVATLPRQRTVESDTDHLAAQFEAAVDPRRLVSAGRSAGGAC